MILPLLFAQTSPDGESNVTLDDERLQEGVPKGLQKVELDLDDALFLLEFEEKEEEPEPEPEPEPEAPAPLPVVQEQKAPPRSRKKLLIFGVAAVLCLLLGAGGAYFFMKSGTEQPRGSRRTGAPADARGSCGYRDHKNDARKTPRPNLWCFLPTPWHDSRWNTPSPTRYVS